MSITAVKIGNSGQKRRLMERRELTARGHPWDSPAHGAGAGAGAAPAMGPGPAASPYPTYPTTLHESKRLEHRRRLEMAEAEHRAKMELLRVEKETAEIKRRIALREEASSALTCR